MRVGVYGKAIAASLTTAGLLLLGFITGDESFTDVSTREWIQIVIEVFGVGGIVYAVPNRAPAAHAETQSSDTGG